VRRLVAGRVLLGLLVLPAVVLTVLRLTQPGWGPAVRVVAFTPYALPGYALAAVAAVLLLVWGRRRAIDLALTGVVVAGLVLHTVWVWPLFTGDAPEPAGEERVVVMTANASFGEADAEAVVAAVREAGVEVLTVSEIDGPFLSGLERAGLDEVLPYRAGGPGESIEGTMVFGREPVETVAEIDTSFDGLVVRTLDLTWAAVHPQPPVHPDAWRRDHAAVLDAAREHDVDVVFGDLNATLDHAPVHRLVDAGWRDAVELANDGFLPTWPSHGEYAPFPGPVVAIDHVMVGDGLTVTDVDTVDIPGTDHRGVVARLAPS
jgi:endonuclease/exonuclease/phosphatase (EEP) superfamily protein YafD